MMKARTGLAIALAALMLLLGACGDDDTSTPDEPATAHETTKAVTTGSGGMIFENDVMGFVPKAEVILDDGETVMLRIDEEALAEIFPDDVAIEGVKVTIEWVDDQQLITGRAD